MSWRELRTSVLLGSERREPALPAWADALAVTGDSSDVEPDVAADERTLMTVAIAAAERRAGLVLRPTRHRIEPAPNAAESFAPEPATQLLDVLLSGGAVAAAEADDLLAMWLDTCRQQGMVLAHRQLVSVISRASARSGLRDHVTPVVGARGRWLAAQRSDWEWCLDAGPVDSTESESLDDEGFLSLTATNRTSTFALERARDPEAAVHRLERVWKRLDAPSRNELVIVLRTGLGDYDADLLESALDDRSKRVKSAAASVLDGLPTSARAARFAAVLEGSVTTGSRQRPTVEVSGLSGVDTRDILDGRPDTMLVDQWNLQCVVAGAPLEWWETTTGALPEEIVNRPLEPAEDLIEGWVLAAEAQRNESWARALLGRGLDARLLDLVDPADWESTLEERLSDATAVELASLLTALPKPWSDATSQIVISRLKDIDAPSTFLEMHHAVIRAGVPATSRDLLHDWLAATRNTPTPEPPGPEAGRSAAATKQRQTLASAKAAKNSLVRSLRTIVRHQTTHDAIIEAFQ